MEVIDEGINALVRQNIYSSKEAVITDVVRALLELKPGLKIEITINLYKNSKVSLWKAAETAGLRMEEFKDILSARNIKIEIGGTKEESKQRIKDALGA
jgi:predicted HTH domain antitoxin